MSTEKDVRELVIVNELSQLLGKAFTIYNKTTGEAFGLDGQAVINIASAAVDKSQNIPLNSGSTTKVPVVAAVESELNKKVSLSGNEAVAGVKTFSSSPIVPSPTAAQQAASKKYVDDSVATRQAALTFGIADANAVKINDADVAVGDYARFTALGLQGRSAAEVVSDLGAEVVANKNVAGGYAGLGLGGKVLPELLPDFVLGQVRYGGTFSSTGVIVSEYASLNGQNISSIAAADYFGYYFIALASITVHGYSFFVGDWLISNGSAGWGKVDNTDAVTSVAGRTGAITLTKSDITDFPNKWAWEDLSGVPVTFAPSSHSHEWADLTNPPASYTPSAHVHGNISNDGKIGTTADYVVVTGSGGTLTTASRAGIDSRSSFPPADHAHDNRYYTETEINNFFSGAIAIAGYNKTNWDTAYGWGNHASAGYASAATLSSHISDTSSHLSATDRTYFNKLKDYLKIAADNTSIYTIINFYSESGVSAFGIGTGGGGGGGTSSVITVDALTDTSYDPNRALSSYQGYILNSSLSNKQPLNSQLTALSGLTGNGLIRKTGVNSYVVDSASYEPAFSKNTAFNKSFGTSAGTVAEGNDSRIVNGQTAFGWGNHAGMYLPLSGGTITGVTYIGASDNTLWRPLFFRRSGVTAFVGVGVGLELGTNDGYLSIGNTSMTFVESGITSRTVIHSGNIGSQSVNYAASAGNASNISNSGTVTLGSAIEANSITITQPSYTTDKPVKLLNFNWYSDTWSLGNIRSDSTPSRGLGVYLNSIEKYRFTDSTLFINSNTVYHSGNSNSSSVPWAASTFTEGGTLLSNKYTRTNGVANVLYTPYYLTVNLNTVDGLAGIVYTEGQNCTNAPTSYGSFLQFADEGGNDVRTQFWNSHDGAEVYTRIMWGNTYWKPWRKLWHDGNLTNTLTSGYLPYWNGSSLVNSPIYTNAINIAIGLNNAYARLTLKGGVGDGFRMTFASSISAAASLMLDASENPYWSMVRASDGVETISLKSSGYSFFLGGNIGIGYTDRTEKFAVAGTIWARDGVKFSNGGGGPAIIQGSEVDGFLRISNNNIYTGDILFQSENITQFALRGGKVDIGWASNPNLGYKLAVNGSGYFNGSLTNVGHHFIKGVENKIYFDSLGAENTHSIGVINSYDFRLSNGSGTGSWLDLRNDGSIYTSGVFETYGHARIGFNGSSGLYIASSSRYLWPGVGGSLSLGTSGIDRIYITGAGFSKMSNTGYFSNVSGSYHEILSDSSLTALISSEISSGSADVLYLGFRNLSPDDNSRFLNCYSISGSKFLLYASGRVWAANYIESASYLKGTSIKIGANWEAIPSGTSDAYLDLKYNGVLKARLDSSGNITAVGGVTAFAV